MEHSERPEVRDARGELFILQAGSSLKVCDTEPMDVPSRNNGRALKAIKYSAI